MSVHLTKADLLHWLRQDCERALERAADALTEDTYDVTAGLFTRVRIEAADGTFKKFAKYKQVGDAMNLRQWEDGTA